MLERLLAVLQNILAYVTQVDIQVTIVAVGVGQLGIHEPEGDVLDVRFLEIGVVQSSHDTRPALLGVGQLAVRSDLAGADVIRSAFLGVEAQVQCGYLRILVGECLTVREELLFIYYTCAHVAQCIHIVLDVLRRVALRVAEDGVGGEP